MPETDVVVIGGGISGLTVAYYLGRAGIACTLVEKSARLGGLIATESAEGCDLEAGPDSFIASKIAVQELAASLGIADRIIPSNDARRGILVARHNSLQPLPPGMIMMAPSNVRAALNSGFFSWKTKLRFLRELRFRPQRRQTDVSLGQFVADHFGSEVLATIAEPLLTGVYGGDPGHLSVASVLPRFLGYEEQYGSLIRGVRRERKARAQSGSLFLSFDRGMQTLTDCLAERVRKTARVVTADAESIERIAGGWQVRTSAGVVSSSAVVLALPAWAAGKLVAALDAEAASLLGAIPYSSAILATFVFDRAEMADPLDGFGFLVPRAERRTIAAATWINTKFPQRVAANRVAIRVFVVGETALDLASSSDSSVLDACLSDLQRWMQFQAKPLAQLVYRWPNSMPQYTVGHQERIRSLQDRISQHPGLFVSGNAYDGVGIPDSIRLAKQVSERLTNYCNLHRIPKN